MNNIPTMSKITVKQAARLMDKSEMFVRIGLQRGILPIGTAIKLNGKHYTYYISPKLFKDYTGIDPSEEREQT